METVGSGTHECCREKVFGRAASLNCNDGMPTGAIFARQTLLEA